MNLKQQIRRLLALEFLSSFHLAGTAWVALLAVRGFSPVEIGLAEGFFHIVSLCGEIPSGMLADLLGRKKTLAASQVLCALAAAAMMTSRGMAGLCLAMALTAVSYNLISGTREALTYDSLIQAGEEAGYLRLSSAQNVVYRVAGAGGEAGPRGQLRAGYFLCRRRLLRGALPGRAGGDRGPGGPDTPPPAGAARANHRGRPPPGSARRR